jgi:DNA replication protein DnaC
VASAHDEGFTVDGGGNYAAAKLSPRPPCAFCGDTGRREVEMNGVRRVGRCRCQALPDRVTLFNAARIPARHAENTLTNFKTMGGSAVPLTQVRGWLNAFKPADDQQGLVLHGLPGRGKTHLLVGLLRELIFTHGQQARFIEFSHLVSDIREGISRNLPDSEALGPTARVPILAIDELGKGRKTDFELAIIDEIVSRRYNARRMILATTNFPLSRHSGDRGDDTRNLAVAGQETLAERLGDRVYSRLREMCRFVEVVGEDHRVVRGR